MRKGVIVFGAAAGLGASLIGVVRWFLREGHAPGILPQLWTLSYALPIPQRLRLAAKRLISYSFMVGAVAVIRAPDGRGYLLAQHRYPLNQRHERWGLPGGAVEQYEQIQQALRREVAQELGVELEVGRLLAVDVSAPPLLDFVFEATIVSGAPMASSEVASADYFPLHRLPPATAARHRAILRRVAAHAASSSGWPLFIGPNDDALA